MDPPISDWCQSVCYFVIFLRIDSRNFLDFLDLVWVPYGLKINGGRFFLNIKKWSILAQIMLKMAQNRVFWTSVESESKDFLANTFRWWRIILFSSLQCKLHIWKNSYSQVMPRKALNQSDFSNLNISRTVCPFLMIFLFLFFKMIKEIQWYC